MKRNLIVLMIMAATAAFIPFSSEAQGLGGLLKKGKEVLDKVTTTKDKNSDKTADDKPSKVKEANSMTFENGIEMINPLSEYIEVTPIGLYGSSTSENFGNAYLVVKVLMKEPQNTANFGGNSQMSMIAVDGNGKVYNTKAGIYSYDTPEGIPVNIILNKNEHQFTGIKKNIEVLPMVKFGIWVDSQKKGLVTLKNVPIFWDQSPE